MATLFTELFGASPEMRTLDFLLIHKNYDYSLTELARNANVGWTTINLFWKVWIKKRFVVKTRRIGRATLYSLNQKNPFIREIMILHNKILSDFIDEEIARQKPKNKIFLSSSKSDAKA